MCVWSQEGELCKSAIKEKWKYCKLTEVALHEPTIFSKRYFHFRLHIWYVSVHHVRYMYIVLLYNINIVFASSYILRLLEKFSALALLFSSFFLSTWGSKKRHVFRHLPMLTMNDGTFPRKWLFLDHLDETDLHYYTWFKERIWSWRRKSLLDNNR